MKKKKEKKQQSIRKSNRCVSFGPASHLHARVYAWACHRRSRCHVTIAKVPIWHQESRGGEGIKRKWQRVELKEKRVDFKLRGKRGRRRGGRRWSVAASRFSLLAWNDERVWASRSSRSAWRSQQVWFPACQACLSPSQQHEPAVFFSFLFLLVCFVVMVWLNTPLKQHRSGLQNEKKEK